MMEALGTKAQLPSELDFERLIADITAKLAQAEPEQLNDTVDSALRSLGQFLRTERSFLAQFSEGGNRLLFTNMWAVEGISLSSSIFEVDLVMEIPWIAQQIRKGRVINAGPGLAGLPDEAEDLRNWLERDGINSGIVVPIRVEDQSIGLLGLDTVFQPREYPQSVVERLQMVADMIGATLHRIRAQKKLQQYQHIVESTNSAVALVDRNYVYQYVNAPYYDAFEKNSPDIIGMTVADLFGQEMFDNILKPQYDRCFAGEEVAFRSWFDLPGWGSRFMDVRYSPFFSSGRKVSAVVVSAHDITEVKQLEMKLKESEERFRAFMDNNPASIYIKDENDRHIYGNPAALESVGKRPEEFIGSTTRDFFPPELADRLIELDRKVLEENIARVTEEWRDSAEGDVRWRKDIKFPIKLGPEKKLLGGIAIDITEIKQSQQELLNAYGEIERLNQKLEQENVYLREEISLQHRHHHIVGQSDVMKAVLSQTEKVAAADCTVLILGETGTGKELLAHAIHNLSSRKEKPMLTVNCSALPGTLIESELFGREKGAYTGALTKRIGRFEVADRSTIFLDEISELPLELQSKLLRVLEDGTFERLGSSQTLKVDVRVIAATNRDLAKEVSQGRFREDLYYRLNVFPLTVPPLRERREDIPLIVWAFVKEYGEKMGRRIESIPRNSMQGLQRYSWPGNVRELKNVVERAVILSKGPGLHVEVPEIPESEEPKSIMTLKELEKNHIVKTLEKTKWRVSGEKGAARILDINSKTLFFRMKKLGIRRSEP